MLRLKPTTETNAANRLLEASNVNKKKQMPKTRIGYSFNGLGANFIYQVDADKIISKEINTIILIKLE